MPLPQELTTALAAVAAAPRLLVATDFDGVLAPFVLAAILPVDARPLFYLCGGNEYVETLGDWRTHRGGA